MVGRWQGATAGVSIPGQTALSWINATSVLKIHQSIAEKTPGGASIRVAPAQPSHA